MQTIEKTDGAVETMDGEVTVRFEDLGLSDEVLAAVRDMGYETPTPVQAATRRSKTTSSPFPKNRSKAAIPSPRPW